jgi:hypothetical protein
MADWTTIPDSSIEPGKPIRSIDGLALRDNPIAIAEGAVGAPKVQPSTAIQWGSSTNTNDERDWVLGRTAGATALAVGTYAIGTSGSGASSGSTVAGSSIGLGSGTWRSMGGTRSYLSSIFTNPTYGVNIFTFLQIGVFLRIS